MRETTVLKAIERWLDIRPHEIQKVIFCVLGAFLLLAFVILARSVREGMFLSAFDVKKLPYITAAVACLSLPAVGLFAGLLARLHPWIVLRRLSILFCVGLGAIWAASQYINISIVAFYIWTAVGTMLLTSGFWVLVAESFAVRGAKRLFGLITAGGTAGAMVTGLSMSWITPRIQLIHLIPVLIVIVLLLYLVERRIYSLPRKDSGTVRQPDNPEDENRDDAPKGLLNISGNLGAILKSPYLRSIASLVFVATIASSIVDFQFKEFAQINIGSGEELAGFFGSFYGWAGGIALAMQLTLTSRIIGTAGVAFGLSVLPLLLLLGSTGFLFLPGLVLATLVRGGDNILRKSLQRPMLEFLYVPVPALIRRKTKTFIDSFVDSAAEGTGAAVIFLWIVLAGGSSRDLSVLVVLLSVMMLVFSRRTGKQYLSTIVNRLKEGKAANIRTERDAGPAIDLLTASFSRMDVQSLFIDRAAVERSAPAAPPEMYSVQDNREQAGVREPESTGSADIASILMSNDNSLILRVLSDTKEWTSEQIRLLTRLLARDALRSTVAQSLVKSGSSAMPSLVELLQDEEADFVIRRRIPRIVARIGGLEAEHALLNAFFSGRFEIRYRSVIAMVSLRKRDFLTPGVDMETIVWKAIRNEVRCSRPVWEMRRLLDSIDSYEEDGLVAKRVDARSSLSLEHTFRMLTLVLDPEPVTAALHGILSGNEDFKSYALEYLERALPVDIKERLWLFIGDAGEASKDKETRPLQKVVADLMSSRATLFYDETERNALEKMLKKRS